VMNPQIERVVEIDIRQQGTDHAPHAIDNFRWRGRVGRSDLRARTQDRRRRPR
jgi:hypothetical protein